MDYKSATQQFARGASSPETAASNPLPAGRQTPLAASTGTHNFGAALTRVGSPGSVVTPVGALTASPAMTPVGDPVDSHPQRTNEPGQQRSWQEVAQLTSAIAESVPAAVSNLTDASPPSSAPSSAGFGQDQISDDRVMDLSSATLNPSSIQSEPEPEPEPGPSLELQLACFKYTGTVVDWIVPPSCTEVRITACGACGNAPGKHVLGKKIQGHFKVTPGETLLIMVGARPRDRFKATGSIQGDGGATYVVRDSDSKPLLIANGGSVAGSNRKSPPSSQLGTISEMRMLPDGPAEICFAVSRSVIINSGTAENSEKTKKALYRPPTVDRTRDIPPILSSHVEKKPIPETRSCVRTVKVPVLLRRARKPDTVNKRPSKLALGQVIALVGAPHKQGVVTVAPGSNSKERLVQLYEDYSENELRAELIQLGSGTKAAEAKTIHPLKTRTDLITALLKMRTRLVRVDFGLDTQVCPIDKLRIPGGSGFVLADGSRRSLGNNICANAGAMPKTTRPKSEEPAMVAIYVAASTQESLRLAPQQKLLTSTVHDKHLWKRAISKRKVLEKEFDKIASTAKAAADLHTQEQRIKEQHVKEQEQQMKRECSFLTSKAQMLLEAKEKASAAQVQMREVQHQAFDTLLGLAAEIPRIERQVAESTNWKPGDAPWAKLDEIRPNASTGAPDDAASIAGWETFYQAKGLPPRIVHLRSLPRFEVRARQLMNYTTAESNAAPPEFVYTQVAFTNLSDDSCRVTMLDTQGRKRGRVAWQHLDLPPHVSSSGREEYEYTDVDDVPPAATCFFEHRALTAIGRAKASWTAGRPSTGI